MAVTTRYWPAVYFIHGRNPLRPRLAALRSIEDLPSVLIIVARSFPSDAAIKINPVAVTTIP